MKLPLALVVPLVLIPARAADSAANAGIIPLPALRIEGRAARAHSQGLECVGTNFYISARLDSELPNRALLLRTTAEGKGWDSWDITPSDVPGARGKLDHPGGMQSDGQRLWIPVAESIPHGQSVIRVYSLDRLVPGQAPASEFDLHVPDHVGAVAVSSTQHLVFGASWDTEKVYVWDLAGRPQRTLSGVDLKARNLGSIAGADGRAGVAVQDWKIIGDRLYASGLFRDPAAAVDPPRSRLFVFTRFLEPTFACQRISLPRRTRGELAQEGMAVDDQSIYYIPDDLGASNRLYRIAR